MLRTACCAVVAATLCLSAGRAAAQTTDAAPVPLSRGSSAIKFTVFAKALFTFKEEGRFTDFDGQVAYDPANPGATHVDVTVRTASVDTSNTEHDQMLRSEDFFDIGEYPTMRFVSTSAVARPDGGLAVTGELTIRGVTKQIEVPIRIQPANTAGGAPRLETSFDIDRTEFGINGSPKWSGFKVSIAKRVNVHLVIATTITRFGQ